jgi:hypothetical protein
MSTSEMAGFRAGEEVLHKFVLWLQKLHGVGLLQYFFGVEVFG